MYELACSDFEEFSRAIQGADSRVMLAGREESDWWLRGVELPRLGVQLAQEGAPNIFEGVSWPNAVNLLMALEGAPFNLNGIAFGHDTIGVLGADQGFTTLAAGRNSWASISMTLPLFRDTFTQPRDGVRILPSADTTHVRTDAAHMSRLHRLVERIVVNAMNGRLDDARMAQAAEGELLYAATLALGDVRQGDHHSRRGRPAISRRVAIQKALEWIRGQQDERVHIGALSEVAGVSERTLRSMFIEWFGIGPLTYLRTRQVHQVHEALVMAESDVTVTSVATRLGVWDQEAMTARYKNVFGETPVATLRRSRRRRRNGFGADDSTNALGHQMRQQSTDHCDGDR